MSAILHDNLICFGVNSQGKVKSIYYIYICFSLLCVGLSSQHKRNGHAMQTILPDYTLCLY